MACSSGCVVCTSTCLSPFQVKTVTLVKVTSSMGPTGTPKMTFADPVSVRTVTCPASKWSVLRSMVVNSMEVFSLESAVPPVSKLGGRW